MDETSSSSDQERLASEEREQGNAYLGYGLGIGALGVVASVVGLAVCPVCVVATPALLGAGVYKRLRARRLGRH